MARTHFPHSVNHRVRLVLVEARKERRLTRQQLAERVSPLLGVPVNEELVAAWERQGDLPTSWLPAVERALGLRLGAFAVTVWRGLAGSDTEAPPRNTSRRQILGSEHTDLLDDVIDGLNPAQRQIVMSLIQIYSLDIEAKRTIEPRLREEPRGVDPADPAAPGDVFSASVAPSMGTQDHRLKPHVGELLRMRCPTAISLAEQLGVSEVYAKRLLERGGPTTFAVVHEIGCLLDLSYRQVKTSQYPGRQIPVGYAVDLEKIMRLVAMAVGEHELIARPASPPYTLERFLFDIEVDPHCWQKMRNGAQPIDVRQLALIAEALDLRIFDLCSPGNGLDSVWPEPPVVAAIAPSA